MDPVVVDPVVDPVVEPEIEPEGDGIIPGEEGDPQPPTEPTPIDGVQKRIDELTRKRRDAERDAAYWRGKAETASTPTLTPTVDAPAELDPDDFDSDSEYLRAVAKQVREEITASADSIAVGREIEQTKADISKAYIDARNKYPDFDSVALNPTVQVTQNMFNASKGESMGDILYYFGKNPGEASRISSLSAIQQTKEIGKLEATITSKRKETTKAPDPPLTVGGGSSSPRKKESEMSGVELRAKWAEERRKRIIGK